MRDGKAKQVATRRSTRLLLDGAHPVYGRRVAFVLQFLIVFSAVAIAVETMPGLPPRLISVLWAAEVCVLVVFAVEYGLRIWSAPNRWRYIFSPLGIVDFIAVVPSILLAGTDLRMLRLLRVLRLLRLLKLLRYMRAADRLIKAFNSVVDELVIFFALALLTIFLSAAGIWFFEHEAQPEVFTSIPHSFWWAIATLTTVGYGDVYPITLGGRIFTFCILMIGLGIVAVPAGLIATALTESRRKDKE